MRWSTCTGCTYTTRGVGPQLVHGLHGNHLHSIAVHTLESPAFDCGTTCMCLRYAPRVLRGRLREPPALICGKKGGGSLRIVLRPPALICGIHTSINLRYSHGPALICGIHHRHSFAVHRVKKGCGSQPAFICGSHRHSFAVRTTGIHLRYPPHAVDRGYTVREAWKAVGATGIHLR